MQRRARVSRGDCPQLETHTGHFSICDLEASSSAVFLRETAIRQLTLFNESAANEYITPFRKRTTKCIENTNTL